MSNRIVLFGTGAISKLLSKNISDSTEIVAYLADNENGSINGIPIISLNDLDSIEYDYIVIAFGNSLKGMEILKKAGVLESKIVGYAYTGTKYEDNFFQVQLENMKSKLIRDDKVSVLFKLGKKSLYCCETNMPSNNEIIERDFVREQTLSYLADEIERKNVPGDVLEIGVAEGNFAKKINCVFKDRRLFLFDTFSGLAKADTQKAILLGWGEKAYAINCESYSEEQVLQTMPYGNNCVIKKGYFPDSYDLGNNPIAFASLDIDFYESTKTGLDIIYPQLSPGGYIMVHDYNNIEFAECHMAVAEFCEENQVPYVPIPDIAGTVVITK